MKKIITLIAALVMVFTMANAQTVVRNGVFSNMYVGISGGLTTGSVTDPIANFNAPVDFKTLPYNVALEIGKNVTPITGFSLNTYARPDFTNGFEMNRLDITGNTKFNLMNLFGGYKGYPRRFEIQTVTGIGFEYKFNGQTNPWDMGLNAGLEFDFNLGKNRAWYITLTPMVAAHEIIMGTGQIQTMAENADLQANLGVAYRFGSNKTGSHNFVICDKVYTEQEYADLYAKYDECMNRPEKVDTVIVEKVVKVQVPCENVESIDEVKVFFKKGSSEISETGMTILKYFVNGLKDGANVCVIGSADSKTGTKKFNEVLSAERANKVADALMKMGVKNVETDTKLDVDKDQEASRCAVIIAE